MGCLNWLISQKNRIAYLNNSKSEQRDCLNRQNSFQLWTLKRRTVHMWIIRFWMTNTWFAIQKPYQTFSTYQFNSETSEWPFQLNLKHKTISAYS